MPVVPDQLFAEKFISIGILYRLFILLVQLTLCLPSVSYDLTLIPQQELLSLLFQKWTLLPLLL